ncbi:MAG: hypothetical protein AAF413_00650 [Patescibacteria group bacterium]
MKSMNALRRNLICAGLLVSAYILSACSGGLDIEDPEWRQTVEETIEVLDRGQALDIPRTQYTDDEYLVRVGSIVGGELVYSPVPSECIEYSISVTGIIGALSAEQHVAVVRNAAPLGPEFCSVDDVVLLDVAG